MEESSSIEYLESLQKSMTTITGNLLHFLSDSDHLMELVKMYHGSYLREVEEINKLTSELESTQDSLKSTLSALQESEHHNE